MASPVQKSKSTERMFKHIALELSPEQRNDPLFGIIENLASQYSYKKQEEYNNNISELRLPFGKYKGKKIESIYADPETRDYIQWIYSKQWLKNKFPDTYKHIKTLMDK